MMMPSPPNYMAGMSQMGATLQELGAQGDQWIQMKRKLADLQNTKNEYKVEVLENLPNGYSSQAKASIAKRIDNIQDPVEFMEKVRDFELQMVAYKQEPIGPLPQFGMTYNGWEGVRKQAQVAQQQVQTTQREQQVAGAVGAAEQPTAVRVPATTPGQAPEMGPEPGYQTSAAPTQLGGPMAQSGFQPSYMEPGTAPRSQREVMAKVNAPDSQFGPGGTQRPVTIQEVGQYSSLPTEREYGLTQRAGMATEQKALDRRQRALDKAEERKARLSQFNRRMAQQGLKENDAKLKSIRDQWNTLVDDSARADKRVADLNDDLNDPAMMIADATARDKAQAAVTAAEKDASIFDRQQDNIEAISTWIESSPVVMPQLSTSEIEALMASALAAGRRGEKIDPEAVATKAGYVKATTPPPGPGPGPGPTKTDKDPLGIM